MKFRVVSDYTFRQLVSYFCCFMSSFGSDFELNFLVVLFFFFRLSLNVNTLLVIRGFD